MPFDHTDADNVLFGITTVCFNAELGVNKLNSITTDYNISVSMGTKILRFYLRLCLCNWFKKRFIFEDRSKSQVSHFQLLEINNYFFKCTLCSIRAAEILKKLEKGPNKITIGGQNK